VKEELQSLLGSVPDRGVWSESHPGHITPEEWPLASTEWDAGWTL